MSTAFSSRYFSCWIFVAQTLDLKSLLYLSYINTYTRSVTANDLSWIHSKLIIKGRKCDVVTPEFINKICRVSKIKLTPSGTYQHRQHVSSTMSSILKFEFNKLVSLSVITEHTYSYRFIIKYPIHPQIFSKLKKLEMVAIEFNLFDRNPGPVHLPDTQLTEISFGSSIPFSVESILKQKQLTTLRLSQMNFQVQLNYFVRCLTAYLSHSQLILTHLTIIRYSTDPNEKCLTDELLSCLPKIPTLESVTLGLTSYSSCVLEEQLLRKICLTLKKLPNLRTVKLTDCLSSTAIQKCRPFKHLGNVEELYLRRTKENNQRLIVDDTLIADLKGMTKLRILHLQNQNFAYKTTLHKIGFYKCLKSMPHLTSYCIGKNNSYNMNICKMIYGIPTAHDLNGPIFKSCALKQKFNEMLEDKTKPPYLNSPFIEAYNFYLLHMLEDINDRWKTEFYRLKNIVDKSSHQISEENFQPLYDDGNDDVLKPGEPINVDNGNDDTFEDH